MSEHDTTNSQERPAEVGEVIQLRDPSDQANYKLAVSRLSAIKGVTGHMDANIVTGDAAASNSGNTNGDYSIGSSELKNVPISVFVTRLTNKRAQLSSLRKQRKAA